MMTKSTIPVSSAARCGVEGRPLDYGLSAVRPLQAVGRRGASRPGDGRRTTAASGWGGRELDCQTDVAPSPAGTESHRGYNHDALV